MKHIDPHVHCRDGKEAYKTTIKKVAGLAKGQGIAAIFDMPNTNPPILREKDVIERLELAGKRESAVKYFLYVGLTSDEKQIREAVEIVAKYPEVVGLKLYPPENENRKIYRALADMGYSGVLAVHCEKESLFKPKSWNPQKPWTHGSAQPQKAEIQSIKEQIKFAKEVDFRGKLHICHITLPESVDLVLAAKEELQITSGVTPHHFLFSDDLMRGEAGLLYKVNPPLRSQAKVEMLREYLKEGKIDIYESDYAPHTEGEKLGPPYLSGMSFTYFYQGGLIWMYQQGMSEAAIEKLTYCNIKEIFGEKLREV